jgi:recombinational DNA repair protein (RecF pathway)
VERRGGKSASAEERNPWCGGAFTLYQGKDEGKKTLKSVDVADDMLKLRTRARALLATVGWAKLLTRHLMEGHPADDLLANLYWNMKLLSEGEIPVEVLEWRFVWRWLKSWGLAPEVTECVGCTPEEANSLRKAAALKTPELRKWAMNMGAAGCLFVNAACRAEGFLKKV